MGRKTVTADLKPYFFMLPTILLILFVYLVPFFYSIYISMTDWNGISKEMNFIGLQNFLNIFKEQTLLEVLGNTLVYFVEIVIVQNVVSLATALLLNKKFKGQNFFRATMFLPTVVCTVAVGFIWSLMFDPVNGPVPALFKLLHLKPLQEIIWLGNTRTAIHAVSFVNIWQWAGWSMIIYFAGLQSIDRSLYEACDIDGAGGFQKFVSITMPMLAPSFTVNIVMASIGSLKIFDLPFILTSGGPGHASESLSISIYSNSFLLNKMGYGTAISLVLFLFTLVISIIQTKYLRNNEDNLG